MKGTPKERYSDRGAHCSAVVLVHQGEIPEDLLLKYGAEQSHPVQLDVANLYRMGVKLVKCGDVMSSTSLVRHDPSRTAEALMLLFDELRPATVVEKFPPRATIL